MLTRLRFALLVTITLGGLAAIPTGAADDVPHRNALGSELRWTLRPGEAIQTPIDTSATRRAVRVVYPPLIAEH
ncbi:hypothetical protein ACFQE0_12865 [Methylobacterium komagatae]|uniref:Uncharacterized protein n=1 Tax=Methylobacterium komagatae TaxID=374425 RepID=A0ABW2BJ38_9HYPH